MDNVASSSMMGAAAAAAAGTTSAVVDMEDMEISRRSAPRVIKLTSKEDVLMENLIQFFRVVAHMDLFKSIVQQQSMISLRILDWFVTNYSKKYRIIYDLQLHDGTIRKFMVYHQYKSQLSTYSKKLFDPFCRRDRIELMDQDGSKIRTTVAQLNFFRWAIKDGIINYVTRHYEEIDRDMHDSIEEMNRRRALEDVSVDVDGTDVGDTASEVGSVMTTSSRSSRGSVRSMGSGGGGSSGERRRRREINANSLKHLCSYDTPVGLTFK